MSYENGDVVVVPFPFTDRHTHKRRPALVLSCNKGFHQATSNVLLAMITSQQHTPWPLDTPIKDLTTAGLPAPSLVRLKIFTLDERLIVRKAGRLSAADHKKVKSGLKKLLAI